MIFYPSDFIRKLERGTSVAKFLIFVRQRRIVRVSLRSFVALAGSSSGARQLRLNVPRFRAYPDGPSSLSLDTKQRLAVHYVTVALSYGLIYAIYISKY